MGQKMCKIRKIILKISNLFDVLVLKMALKIPKTYLTFLKLV